MDQEFIKVLVAERENLHRKITAIDILINDIRPLIQSNGRAPKVSRAPKARTTARLMLDIIKANEAPMTVRDIDASTRKLKPDHLKNTTHGTLARLVRIGLIQRRNGQYFCPKE